MAITLANADKALKSFYLDAVVEQLDNSINPFFASIEKSTAFVSGKDVKVFTTYGVNGGIGAGDEDGDLPQAQGNNYEQFTSTLKNLYGVIQISDKAIRASENNAGAFVNLLNAEMDGLLKSSKFNFGRMLFGDGSGTVAKVEHVEDGRAYVDQIQNFYPGMIVDLYGTDNEIILDGVKIIAVDYNNSYIVIKDVPFSSDSVEVGAYFCVHGSRGKEISGLGTIFDDKSTYLYGVKRNLESWLKPIIRECIGGSITEKEIQTTLDIIEQNGGSPANIILCSYGVRRALQEVLSANRRTLDTVELAGGYKAMSYNGIPIVADRFCPKGTMFILNTKDFCLHQLCDWQWLSGDDGKVLQQVAGKPVYTATLVKYAELICSRPNCQAKLVGINEI